MPEMNPTADVAAEAAGNYASQVPVQVECPLTQHEQKDIGIWPDLNQHRPPVACPAPADCMVVEVLVEDGIEVEKGKPLFVLESLEFKGFRSWKTFPEWSKSRIKKNLEEQSRVGIFPMEDVLASQNVENSPMAELHLGDIQTCYTKFKKFDTVLDHSDHLFSSQSCAMKQSGIEWGNRIREEWRILKEQLPETIFVRVYKSRMDLLRAVIIGLEGTPYHHGLFFFDVLFPRNYPDSPPIVRYHSGGLSINPNLFKCGEVRLGLCNSDGFLERMWMKGTSNMLEVLVFIQDQILNAKPYFNTHAHVRGSMIGEEISFLYNENTIVKSLKTMMYTMNKPPKNFEELVVGHFRKHVYDILMSCKAYTEGEQVGCLVSSGNNEICSIEFKNEVASIIKPLVEAFCKIGAKEAQEFLHLSEKKAPMPAYAPIPESELCEHRWTMTALEACTVREVCVKEGMIVKKGQPLYLEDAKPWWKAFGSRYRGFASRYARHHALASPSRSWSSGN